jgi:hypothetical protein
MDQQILTFHFSAPFELSLSVPGLFSGELAPNARCVGATRSFEGKGKTKFRETPIGGATW